MEREDGGGGRYARPPARSERPPDGHNPVSMRQDYVGGGSRPDDRYSGRYDVPAEQQPPRFGHRDHPRSCSRSPVRSRAPHRATGGDGAYPRRASRPERGDRVDRPAVVFEAPPNATLIIKNLPPVADEDMLLRELASFRPMRAHAIRDRETGAPRGFAFVDFESVEHATRVMNTFEYTPLVLAGRAVVMGYASNRRPPPLGTESDRPVPIHRDHSPHQSYRDEHHGTDYSSRPPRLDWLCDQCNATNFSRRTTCFKCFVPKGEHPREVPADFSLARSSPDARHAPSNDSEYYRQHDDRSGDRYDSREGGYSRSPESKRHGSYPSERDAAAPQSNVIAVRQLLFDVDEGQLQVAFAAFTGVCAIRLVRDRATNESRGFAFVEFVDVDAARQAIEMGQNLPVGGGFARLSFAYDTFHSRGHPLAGGDDRSGVYESDYRSRRDDRALSNSIAATALEQAQWALANGYRRSGAQAGDDANADGFQQEQTDIVDDVNALLSSAAEAARPRIEEPKKQWPQPFETGGGSYVFASDVGLYWDQDSMFYYSPASKLYYSVFLGKYFRCDTNSSSSNPFHEVAPPVPVDDSPFVQDVGGQQPAGVQTANATPSALKIASGVSLSLKLPAKKKAPISFGLKPAAAAGGKTLKTAVDNTASSAAFAAGTTPAGVTRRSAQDIAKWSQLQRKTKIEEQQQTKKAGGVGKLPFESASAPNPKTDRAATQVVKTPEPAAAPSVIDALANTAVEVPICLLCRRKFNSMEVLRKHETMSKLHLENLAKSRQDKEAVAAEHRERDRAAVIAREKREREAATQEAEAKRQRLTEAAASSKPAQEAKAAAALEQGIGGKMLKMMGWKSGEGLGKRGTGITAPISASGASASGGSSMAGLGARSALPVSISETASFKERVQSFTRARYDATGAKEQ